MARKKQDSVDFTELLKNNKIPILTLDVRWHELFPEHEKTAQIRNLENKLNSLVKQQGKLVNDTKDLKKLKAKLMHEIVANMGEANGITGRLAMKKQDKSQQLIKDINNKMKQADEQLIDLPYQIKATNAELLVESMKICYDRLRQNSNEIQQIGSWVNRVREELKEKILIKQDKEIQNTAIYSYMHDMIGPQVIELFDDNLEKRE